MVLESTVFHQRFMWRIYSNSIKQETYLIDHVNQSAPPCFTYTFDELIKSFGVNLIVNTLFTTCKMEILLSYKLLVC